MPLLRNIKVCVETYLQNPDGTNGQLCDRASFESCGVDTAEVIAMRAPLLEVGKAWNEGDLDTTDVVAQPPKAPDAAKG